MEELNDDVMSIQGEARSESFRECSLNEHIRILKTLYAGGSTNRYGILIETEDRGLIEFSDDDDDEWWCDDDDAEWRCDDDER